MKNCNFATRLAKQIDHGLSRQLSTLIVVRGNMANNFTFSFEAVLLYLARWEIVDRWTSRDADAGLVRFDQMIEETLGEYATAQF